MSAVFTMDPSQLEELSEKINQYGWEIEQTINSFLKQEGADEIKKAITEIMPVSDRNKDHAKSAMPGAFSQKDGNLFVEVMARGKYGYLIFPDQGTSKQDAQEFMETGAENASDAIIEIITNKLIEKFEG